MARRGIPICAAAVLLALWALPTSSGAKPAEGPLWATVNGCSSSPHSVGVRASLPGSGAKTKMYARFSMEWFSTEKNGWLPVEGVPTSPWLYAGSGKQEYGQVGYTFDFQPPAAPVSVRGVAELAWRRGGEVVRYEQRITSGGVSGVDEVHPGGTVQSTCTLR